VAQKQRCGGQAGFSIVETLVAATLLGMIGVAVYGGFGAIAKGAAKAKIQETALLLASEKLEIARDVSYKDLGLVGGLPAGKLSRLETVMRGGYTFVVTTTIRNIDEPFDGLIGGSPNDLSPADQKLVEIEVSCGACGLATTTLVTRIAPASGLETSTGNGALFVQVLDSSGEPVPGASVHVENSQANPAITIDDLTDLTGFLKIVDAPTGTAAYQIVATKSGYSTDQNYQPGAPGNPVPTVPYANVASGAVTQATFAIDRLATLEVSSAKPTCESVGGVEFDLTGAKTIGLNLFKFDSAEETGTSGLLSLPLEWDTYSVTVTDSSWALIGTNPAQPFPVLPGATQPLSLVVAYRNPNALLVKVRDAGTQLPIADASVTVSKTGYSGTELTGQGSFTQTDWSTGPGQSTAGETPTGFLASDGNADYSTSPGNLRLALFGQSYVPSAWLESSTFDAGTTTNFLALSWLPASQPPEAGAESLRLQVATNLELTATTTWSYVGPDGGGGSYFTAPGEAFPPSVATARYLRYKVFLSTEDPTATPSASDVSATFTEECAPAGQAYFSGLSSGTYTVQVSRSGYQTATDSVSASSAWQELTVNLSPV